MRRINGNVVTIYVNTNQLGAIYRRQYSSDGCWTRGDNSYPAAEFIDPWLGKKVDFGIGLSHTGPPAHVAWRAGTTTLCRSWLYPLQSGSMNSATGYSLLYNRVTVQHRRRTTLTTCRKPRGEVAAMVSRQIWALPGSPGTGQSRAQPAFWRRCCHYLDILSTNSCGLSIHSWFIWVQLSKVCQIWPVRK